MTIPERDADFRVEGFEMVLVGPQGLEPWTSGLKARCSTN